MLVDFLLILMVKVERLTRMKALVAQEEPMMTSSSSLKILDQQIRNLRSVQSNNVMLAQMSRLPSNCYGGNSSNLCYLNLVIFIFLLIMSCDKVAALRLYFLNKYSASQQPIGIIKLWIIMSRRAQYLEWQNSSRNSVCYLFWCKY